MQLDEFLLLIRPLICGGSEFCWSCFGPNARYLDFGEDLDLVSAYVIFDTKTRRIYQIEFMDYPNNIEYIWIDPDFREAYFDEAKQKNKPLEDKEWKVVLSDTPQEILDLIQREISE